MASSNRLAQRARNQRYLILLNTVDGSPAEVRSDAPFTLSYVKVGKVRRRALIQDQGQPIPLPSLGFETSRELDLFTKRIIEKIKKKAENDAVTFEQIKTLLNETEKRLSSQIEGLDEQLKKHTGQLDNIQKDVKEARLEVGELSLQVAELDKKVDSRIPKPKVG